jgi:hypothetical protein
MRFPLPEGWGWLKDKAQALLFLKKKKQKDFCYAGSWALARQKPPAQLKKIFAPLFLKSGCFLP